MPRWMGKKFVPLIVGLLLGHLIFLSLYHIRAAGYMESSEFAAYDLFLQYKPAAPFDDRIVIIGETEQDLQRFGHPLSDGILADALELLTEAGAWSIGVDKYRDIPVLPGTERLANILKQNRNIIWIFNPNIPPPDALLDTDQIALNTVLPDKDGIVRRGVLFVDYADTVGYSFALMMALRYLEKLDIYPAPDEKVPEHIRLGKTTIVPFEATDGSYINADARGYQFLLDYGNAGSGLKNHTLSELLDKKIPADALKGKIVILGSVAESLNDFFFSPFNPTVDSGELMHGAFLHGYIVNQLLRFTTGDADTIKTLTNAQETWWLWGWCILGTLIGLWVYAVSRFVITSLGGIALLIGISYLAFMDASWWLPVVPAIYGFFLSATLVTAYMRGQQKAERQMVMQLFERHVSSAVAETIWEERDRFMESGRLMPQRVTATVLFTDIKGFTTVSEKMDPQELMNWLNTYMDHMAEVIIQHNGTINKYIGDAIMALFGVPLYRTKEEHIAQDARNAVDCALAMSAKLDELNEQWRQQNLPEIGMRVGIFTGPLVAGSLGSSQRLEYTVIGDTVNTASRLESYKPPQDTGGTTHPAEQVNCRILVGENTRKYLDENMLNISHYGSVILKGKEDSVDIYWVTERKGNIQHEINKQEKDHEN